MKICVHHPTTTLSAINVIPKWFREKNIFANETRNNQNWISKSWKINYFALWKLKTAPSLLLSLEFACKNRINFRFAIVFAWLGIVMEIFSFFFFFHTNAALFWHNMSWRGNQWNLIFNFHTNVNSTMGEWVRETLIA